MSEWVYGVTDGEAPDVRGIDGAPVTTVEAGSLRALVSSVAFDEEALRADLEDLRRVEALARAHQGVLGAARGDVLPCPMCTLHSSRESVAAFLREHADALADALERVRGAREWGVKSFWQGQDPENTTGPPASGAEYLMRKRAARVTAEARREAVARVIAEVHERLAAEAAGAVVNRPQDRRLAGYEGEMLLNAAYLVPDERADAFRALVVSLAGEHEDAGLDFELTGPWPPYHFAGEVAVR